MLVLITNLINHIADVYHMGSDNVDNTDEAKMYSSTVQTLHARVHAHTHARASNTQTMYKQ